ncbi:restriction endonuclease subunit S [Trichocoleus sp. DQ-A3]|uniref:restriction endonuclease subunit S n=1 Tax=Cyanophyceae TaxID=3028117 RepID=UPI001681E416|nr:restriction endonuclease subunit S [Coleofasciculus sp. FACHB-125]MBD1902696.1 restriction endonuclease subunit S [Coleofasciculus sp. FACHB-125]
MNNHHIQPNKKGLPIGWTLCQLKDCVDILDSQRVPVNSEERQQRIGNIPYYGATGQVGWIDNFLFDEQLLLIGEDGAPFFDKSKSIAYTISGKSWVNNHAHVLRSIPGLTSNYLLKHYLNQFDFRGYVNGTTRLKLTQSLMSQIPVRLPPLNEQSRIVAKLEKLLAKVDSCKERLDKIPAILKRFRQSVLSAACSGRLTADWRENNPDVEPASELLQRIQEKRQKHYEKECARAKAEGRRKPKKPKEFQLLETYNFDIPKSWALAYPEDICSSKDYSIGIGPFGSNLKVSDYINDGVPLIFVRHIRSGNFAGLEPKYVTPEKAQELLPHMVEPLDLLITKMGEPPGDCEIYPDDRPNGIITSDCLKFRIWETDLQRTFFKHCINSFIIKDQLGLITKGVAQQKISVERFKSILFPVPPFAEQQEIVNRVETLFKLADQIEQRYQKARGYVDQLTQSILAKAFRGELVPQDPNDEPASVLLERIRAERAKPETEAKAAKKSTGKKGGRRGRKPKPQDSEPIQLELPGLE